MRTNEVTELAARDNAIFEYIRKRHGGKTHKIGIIAGVNDGGTIKVGYSKCNIAEDKFDDVLGFKLAVGRAIGMELPHIVPKGLRTRTRQFAARCVRYYKEAKKLELPEFAK